MEPGSRYLGSGCCVAHLYGSISIGDLCWVEIKVDKSFIEAHLMNGASQQCLGLSRNAGINKMKTPNNVKMIHPLADVASDEIGQNTAIWQFVVILPGARVGNNCNICSHCFIENDVTIGDFVTIKNGVYLWDRIVVEDYVFIGPNVTFTNDRYPRSKQYPEEFEKTYIKKGASIGANATIIGGITIGEYSIIGAGSVVTKDVPDYALVYGNPARIQGWVNESGNKLLQVDSHLEDESGRKYLVSNNELLSK